MPKASNASERRTATIIDVARHAGVGLGTASRAISGRGSVSASAVARVSEAVAALNFKPSQAARALSTNRQGIIGVYVQEFAGDFYGPILQTVDVELRAVNRHMVAANGCGGGEARQQALDGVRFLIERQCDGLLVVSNALLDEDYLALWEEAPRLVQLNRHSCARPDHAFGMDHEHAGRLAAQALLASGHREIACIAGPPTAPDNLQRLRGFHGELKRHGVRVAARDRAEGDFLFASGAAAVETLLAGGRPRWTALFCANDLMAMAAIARLREAGLRVPDDLSVLGFDDSPLARHTSPPLTTVRVPIRSATESACRFLINACYGLELPVLRDFPPRIVWRRSVADGPHPPLSFDGDGDGG